MHLCILLKMIYSRWLGVSSDIKHLKFEWIFELKNSAQSLDFWFLLIGHTKTIFKRNALLIKKLFKCILIAFITPLFTCALNFHLNFKKEKNLNILFRMKTTNCNFINFMCFSRKNKSFITCKYNFNFAFKWKGSKANLMQIKKRKPSFWYNFQLNKTMWQDRHGM